MVAFERAPLLLIPGELTDDDARELLTAVGFADWRIAQRRLVELCADDDCRQALGESLSMLLVALSETATPDGSLINFERFAQSVPDRMELFRYLASNPRAVEILVKLFVGSQFLTEILLRNPDYLERLTNHKQLADIKSREQFHHEAREAADAVSGMKPKLDALRRYQKWELLRIGACDSFGLMDLRAVTVQLALLADSLVQTCLDLLAEELDVSPEGFAVLGFGKLGGEELNYSSDIDLVFLADRDPTRFWTLGQRLIVALSEPTGEGFLYRVDMRLRPWGRSGALVNSVAAHVNYLQKHGMLWEKQALLKARVIAGDRTVGREFLQRAEPLIFGAPLDRLRASVREMKEKIEAGLARQGRTWGEVKSGEGSIRDIEFVTQFLQLAHGGTRREVRSFNTLDGLVRLADFGLIQADEYRHLTSGYLFLRTVEHALQLMHHKQTHNLPDDPRELAYLARRLDFPNAEHFLTHYRRHREAVRAVYDKHISGRAPAGTAEPARLPDPRAHMDPSYSATFREEEIERHAELLSRLSPENLIELEAVPVQDGRRRLTIVGYNHLGELSIMCGLLFVYGFDIEGGDVFTDEFVEASPSSREMPARKYVDVFTLKATRDMPSDVWDGYKRDLIDLLRLVKADRQREAAGQLAKRVAAALRRLPEVAATLYPVEIEIDNQASERATVLHIRAEDTIGFLYELANALAMTGIDIGRVTVRSAGQRVFDTLYVTDAAGGKITAPDRERELRAAVVLIKHFTHLLPRSPNPESALLHFRSFLEQLFQQPNWPQELATLERSEVLGGLAKLLGVSDFLWEDFLRLQHENLFPVVKNVDALVRRKARDELHRELQAELAECSDRAECRRRLNAFKDREMFRTDMRHILGYVAEFGQFSEELTDVAEVVVTAAYALCDRELRARYGTPRVDESRPSPLSVCALGKCGGRELGFASDIELMFLYEENGRTTGPEVITTTEYFLKLVESFMQMIAARREGIFQIDLRLRPYGRAGSLAVSLDAFRQYFGPDGAAWPYERQALVKLRPIAGDEEFGRRIVALRDELIYTGAPFDVTAMRAMRERQVRQLVQGGTLNAKLSAGGLVDCEYLVQGLQITHGHRDPSLRTTNTLEAMTALERAGILSSEEHARLQESYIFLRRLIDALRMVRGHARDLTVPPPDREEFEYLARRLGYPDDPARLKDDLDRYTGWVQELSKLLDQQAT